VVQNLNLDFAVRIARQGHRREITDSTGETLLSTGVIPTTREEFLDHIQHLMQRTKGRELPGTFNPMIVADLFLEQSTPWEAITRNHIERVWKAAKELLSFTTHHVADTATSKALLQKIFEPALKQLLETLNDKATELLTPHQKGHPITYNNYFTEALQEVRSERSKNEYTRIIEAFFGVSSLAYVHNKSAIDLHPLVTALVQRTEPDLSRFACSEALDCMQAYYKIVYFAHRCLLPLPLRIP
jgi:hypothetical protein